MTKMSWVEICVSDFEQSIQWFEDVLGFRVTAREENEYAEMSRGETQIQLASDEASYWELERPQLLPAGQRGSGVEIVLLVDNVDAIYRQAQEARAEIVRPLADYPWHMRQFWVRHPDGYLIRPAQRLLSVNSSIYRRQVADAFRQDKPRVVEELRPVKETADKLVYQQDYLGAATIYQALVSEIFEQSHLYFNEEEAFDDYYEEEWYFPEEEGLEELVRECIEALGNCLADERADRVAREKIMDVLFEIYEHDLHSDGTVNFSTAASDQLVKYTTSMERHTIAEWIREALADEDEEVTISQRHAYGKFLLELERDTLDDEAYLQICRETGLTSDLVDRLLAMGRVDEAARETQQVNDDKFLVLADIFIRHGQDNVAERLAQERIKEQPKVRVLEWLQNYYHARSNYTAELEIAETLFRTQPYLKRYQELRELAKQLGRWETLRSALLDFLDETQSTTLLIQIALDEGDIDKALELLKKSAKKDMYGYTYSSSFGYGYYGNIALEVARAAEETRPREAITLYQQQAERLIAQRQRKYYQEACKYLAKMRVLYEKIGESDEWARYIADLREKHRNLRALKEELVNAGL